MAKKNTVSNHPKQQTPPMSSSHSNIIGAPATASPQPLDDDDDDICPVCESECTCHNRTAPAPSASQSSRLVAAAPSAPSLSTFDGSFASSAQTLKIKLTLPPSLKFRRQSSVDHQHIITTSAGHIVPTLNNASTDVHSHGRLPSSTPSITEPQYLAPVASTQPVPKRRGRPPKTLVAARQVVKAAPLAGAQGVHAPALARAHGPSTSRITPKYPPTKKRPVPGINKRLQAQAKSKARTTTGKKPLVARKRAASLLLSESELSDLSDSERFPTFVPAASTETHSSSSESDSSESDADFGLDSDIEAEETSFVIRDEQARVSARKLLDGVHKKRDHGNNWEIRPRKKSVGAEGEEDAGLESGESSDEDDNMDEDSDGEEDADEELEADAEGEGLAEIDPDDEDTSGRLGVSFGGGASNWSEDEESSFDADLFFANLDDTSDSGSDSPARGEDGSDAEASSQMTADEEDSLLLMDIDPSVSLRRSNGELEFGVGLDTFSFGWDGNHYLFASARLGDHFDVGFSTDTVEADVDMVVHEGDGSRSDTHSSSDSEHMSLEETDGETTEDELVDADGLPNSRAMMLFRWPSAVSTVDPQSTMGKPPCTPPRAPDDASESMRIALASMSAQCKSPPPTPADILAGRISMDDLDDIELDKRAHAKRCTGPPTMGEFIAGREPNVASAIIDGSGADVPSPFPRSKRSRRRQAEPRGLDGSELSSGTTDHFPSNAADPFGSSVEDRTHLQASDFSSTEAIDLDDVLDSSFMDSDPLCFDFEAPLPSTPPVGSITGPHMRSLTRWDRIPMATFRRTRETAVESASSDTGHGAFTGLGALIGSAMLTQPKPTEKKSPSSTRKRSKGKHAGNVLGSPILLPFRDGDRTPTSSSPNNGHQVNRPQKEVRREKAMMKRKMMGKPSQYKHQQPHRAHNHLPNFKTRASSSIQRGSSSMPPPSL